MRSFLQHTFFIILIICSFQIYSQTDTVNPSLEVLKVEQAHDGTIYIYVHAADLGSGLNLNTFKAFASLDEHPYNLNISFDARSEDFSVFDAANNIYVAHFDNSRLFGFRYGFDNGTRLYWRVELEDNAGNKILFPHSLNYEPIMRVFDFQDPKKYLVDFTVCGDDNFFNENALIPVRMSSDAFSFFISDNELEIRNNTGIYYATDIDPATATVDGTSFLGKYLPSPRKGVININLWGRGNLSVRNFENIDTIKISADRKEAAALVRNSWVFISIIVKHYIKADIPDDLIFAAIDAVNSKNGDQLLSAAIEYLTQNVGTGLALNAIKGFAKDVFKEHGEKLITEINLRRVAKGQALISLDGAYQAASNAFSILQGINQMLYFNYSLFRHPFDNEYYEFIKASKFKFNYNWAPGDDNSYNPSRIYINDTTDLTLKFNIPNEKHQTYHNTFFFINLYHPTEDTLIESAKINYAGVNPSGGFETIIDELDSPLIPNTLPKGQGVTFSPSTIGGIMSLKIQDYAFIQSSTGFNYQSYVEPYRLTVNAVHGGLSSSNFSLANDTMALSGNLYFQLFDNVKPSVPLLFNGPYQSEHNYSFFVQDPLSKDIAGFVIYKSDTNYSNFTAVDTLQTNSNDSTLYMRSYTERQSKLAFLARSFDISGNYSDLSDTLFINPEEVNSINYYVEKYNLKIYEPDSINLTIVDKNGNPLAGVPIKISSSKNGYSETDIANYGAELYSVTDLQGNLDFKYFPLESGQHFLSFEYNNSILTTIAAPIIVSSQYFFATADSNVIKEMEYWFNDDYSTKKSLLTPPKFKVSLSTVIPFDSLVQGINTLHYRFKDYKNAYSVTQSSLFMVYSNRLGLNSKMIRYRYWIDQASNIKTGNTQNRSDLLFFDLSSMDTLSNGLHKLYLQFKDENELWSVPIISNFIKTADYESDRFNIDSVRVLIGEDTLISNVFNKIEQQYSDTFSLNHYQDGGSYAVAQFMDTRGQWSSPIMKKFIIETKDSNSTIFELRYWFNDDTANMITVSDSTYLTKKPLITYSIDSLPRGINSVYFQIKDNLNRWSSPLVKKFINQSNDSNNIIIRYRYWLNEDTSAIVYSSNVFPSLVKPMILDSLFNIPIGHNTLYFQGQDTLSRWSSPVIDTFSFNPSPEPAFNFNVQRFCDSITVQFNNLSTYSDSYIWDFGDGNSDTSFSPTHTFLNYGTYTITLSAFNSVTGLDSTLIENSAVSFNENIYSLAIDTSLCLDDSLTITLPNNYKNISWSKSNYTGTQITLDSSFTENYIAYNAIDQNNCVTIDTAFIQFYRNSDTILFQEICHGDSIAFNQVYLSHSGLYTDTINSLNFQCDSIVSLDLTVLPKSQSLINTFFCSGSDYTLPSGIKVTLPGLYSDTLSSINGCDSIISINLDLEPSYLNSVFDTICAGDSIFFGNSFYSLSGIYLDSLTTNSYNCDSLFQLHLTVLPSYTSSVNAIFCAGSVYNSPSGLSYTQAGVYYDTLISSNGCDSIIQINLIENPVFQMTLFDTICQGDSIPFNQSFIRQTGVYTDTLSSLFSCDSIISMNLFVLPKITHSINTSFCLGSNYMLPSGQIISQPGFYVDTLVSFSGCDSIISINLAALPSYRDTVFDTICQGDSYHLSNNQIVTTSGIYLDSLMTGLGCDSIIVINLFKESLDTTIGLVNDSLYSNQGNALYQWLDCDDNYKAISGATRQFYKPITNGRYALKIDYQSCVDTSDCVGVFNIGLIDQLENYLIDIYPNPTSSLININGYVGFWEKDFTIYLFDVSGKTLYQNSSKTYEGAINHTIDVSSLSQGIYTIQISLDQQSLRYKILKNK